MMKKNQLSSLLFVFFILSLLSCSQDFCSEEDIAILEDRLKKTKDSSKSVEITDSLIQCGVSSAELYSERGFSLTILGQWASAVESYSIALELGADSNMVFYNRAQSYAAMQNKQAAMSDLKAFISTDPEDRGSYLDLAVIVHRYLKEYSISLKYTDSLEVIEGHRATLHYDKALTLLNMYDTLGYCESMRKSIALGLSNYYGSEADLLDICD